MTRRWSASGRFGRLLVVAALAALLGACDLLPVEGAGPLRYRDELFDDVTTRDGIDYGSAVGEAGEQVSLELDVYEPEGDRVRARPLIIWVHGGGFTGGNRTSPEIVDEATTFARKGYVSASISYRLSSVGCFPPGAACIEAIKDAREDAQAAVRFFRANAARYRIDPTRIAIAGTSAGAITALGVGFLPDQPGDSGNPDQPSDVRAAVSLSGAAVFFTDEIDAGDAPSLLFHGTADGLVPYGVAVATVDVARAAGLPTNLVTWEGDGHVPYVKHRDEILSSTTNFLYRRLDAANAAR